MNIFALDLNPKQCARYHCDIHVRKMLLETIQLLCNTYYYTDFIPYNSYLPYNLNHPCSIWARKSLSNWSWLYELALELYEEFKYRRSKKHASGERLLTLPIPNIKDIGITERPQCMPTIYKDDDIITAYRNYYIYDKTRLLKYSVRDIPFWIKRRVNMNSGMSRERELSIEILDLFEELLEEKNITIPSEDREGNESEARIYGSEYYSLEDRITEILEREKLMKSKYIIHDRGKMV
jgi:hypothetical protein